MTHVPTMPDTSITSCGDVSCEFLVDPIPRPKTEPFTVRMRPDRPRVVLVDNRKPNSMEILQRTQQLLRTRGIDVEDVIAQKHRAGAPMKDEMLQRLSADGGLVLAGVSD